MLGHISFGVRDLARATAFYDAVMAALGYARVYSGADAVGYGLPGADAMADRLLLAHRPDSAAPPGPGFHLAFDAPSHAAVERFHAEGLSHGGTDNGAPGFRPRYGPHYYAAFVIDPDGYRLEAKYRAP